MTIPNAGSSPNDLRMLGFNLGSDDRDYAMLLGQVRLKPEDTLKSLSDEYRKLKNRPVPDRQSQPEAYKKYRADKKDFEEKLFFILGQKCPFPDQDKTVFTHIDSCDEILASLIIDNGLDILETNMTDPVAAQFIKQNSEILLGVLGHRIKDKFGADQMRKTYPNLCKHLYDNFNTRLPLALKQSKLNALKASGKKLFKRMLPKSTISQKTEALQDPKTSPLQRQLQSIKNRLSENYFSKVISGPSRPAVISLQEVYNKNSGVLDILRKGNYFVSEEEKPVDTMIILDKTRFKDCQMIDLSYSIMVDGQELEKKCAAAYAKDVKTNEEYLFISVHIPGFTLELPQDPALLDDHFADVDVEIRDKSLAAIQQLKVNIGKLKDLYPDAHVVIQGDFNTAPEYFEQSKITESIKEKNIFNIMKKQGFELVRTGKPTEKNSSLENSEDQQRELDYVLASKSLQGRVKPIEEADPELSLVENFNEKEGGMLFGPHLLPSDHRPITTVITPKPQEPEEGAER